VNYQRHFGQQRLSSTERMSIFEVRSRGR
jgi:hypothetical protein